ncbi:hypothetical protein [Streptomyces sp. KR80]|uniref:hypothetical protein n=1 Tax=Streptomyces sp. KR80 TaxID=3457426 RepID=UPI003FD1334B
MLRERLRRIERVWMVAGAGIEEQEWFRRSRREQAKLATLRQDFTELSRVGVRSGTVALHERNGPPPAVRARTGPAR